MVNVSRDEIAKALELANEDFDGNLIFNRFETVNVKGTRHRVTIKTQSYDKPGYRRTHSGRRHPSACWHAWGTFIDRLFEIQPNAKVHANGSYQTADSWYWQDRNIGSIMVPLYFSEACDC
jgi:hypothetical protein